LGGLKVFGLIGIVLGPVVFAITLSLLETFSRNTQISDQTSAAQSSSGDASDFRTAA
jgi:predicted PurR-regulated permease PerM